MYFIRSFLLFNSSVWRGLCRRNASMASTWYLWWVNKRFYSNLWMTYTWFINIVIDIEILELPLYIYPLFESIVICPIPNVLFKTTYMFEPSRSERNIAFGFLSDQYILSCSESMAKLWGWYPEDCVIISSTFLSLSLHG